MGITELWLIVLMALVMLVAGGIQGALGFGYAIAALTTLPWLLSPHEVHIIISLSSIPVMILAAWSYRQHAHWREMVPALGGSLLAMPIGIWTFSLVSSDTLIRGTGLAILLVMLLELRSRPAVVSPARGIVSPLLAGLLSGYLTGAVSIGGPPIVAYALRQGWPPGRARAFMTGCLLLISVMKCLGLVAADFVTPRLLGLSVGVTPAAILGVWWGTRWGRSLSAVHYRRLVASLLILISTWWLIRGSG